MPNSATRKSILAVKSISGSDGKEASRQDVVTSAFDNILGVYSSRQAFVRDLDAANVNVEKLATEQSELLAREKNMETQLKKVEEALSEYGNLAFTYPGDSEPLLQEAAHRMFVSHFMADIKAYATTTATSARATTRIKAITTEVEDANAYVSMLLGIKKVVDTVGMKRARKQGAEDVDGNDVSKRVRFKSVRFSDDSSNETSD